jgi:TonB family protein
MKLGFCAVGVVLLLGVASRGFGAEEPPPAESLALARDLYGAAEYERALGILDHLRTSAAPAPGSDVATLEQYRALCLLALGRSADAEQAIAALVLADPAFVPSDSAMSPRLRATFREIRTRTLPAAVQRQYDAAKAAFDRREFAAAAVGFSGVLRMMSDPDLVAASTVSPLSDIRTLSQGFRDLSTSASLPPQSAPAAPAPTVPQAAPPRIFSSDDGDVVAPVTERQSLPPFPAQLTARGNGMLELVIDERGAVESAIIRVSINPRYDRLVLDAARSWHYRPATRGGVPVKYRKAMQIAVKLPQP